MKAQITYGTVYGSTERYAKKLGELTGLPVTNYEEVTNLDQTELLIHFGGLHAGGVLGLKKMAALLPKEATLLLVTVGLVDVTDTDNITMTRKMVKIQLPKERYHEENLFHLRGAIDYERLTPKHRAIMNSLYRSLRLIPKGKRSARDRIVIDTYNTKADFVDFDALTPILDAIKKFKNA